MWGLGAADLVVVGTKRWDGAEDFFPRFSIAWVSIYDLGFCFVGDRFRRISLTGDVPFFLGLGSLEGDGDLEMSPVDDLGGKNPSNP